MTGELGVVFKFFFFHIYTFWIVFNEYIVHKMEKNFKKL